MTHHIFIHFIFTVDHFLLSAYQSSVLLSQSGACVERAHLNFPGLADLMLLTTQPLEGESPMNASPGNSTCYLAPILEEALCSIRMNETGVFQRADGNNEDSAYLYPAWKDGMQAFGRVIIVRETEAESVGIPAWNPRTPQVTLPSNSSLSSRGSLPTNSC